MPQAGLSVDGFDVRQRDERSDRQPREGASASAETRAREVRAREARARARARRDMDDAGPRRSSAGWTENRDGASVTSLPRADLSGPGVPGRRTIEIRGHGAERYRSTAQRRRPPRPVHERVGFRPDRMAMWAVLLGVLMILAAATSSHAAVRTARQGASGSAAALYAPAGGSAPAPSRPAR